jgi:hypothetical protein
LGCVRAIQRSNGMVEASLEAVAFAEPHCC